ncbi:hypothetical protein [Hahella ganghwensis]|uniref:hypothetical protein n=1 Tax=Hahella ganghwensis TaxID=286420 RepID=UPI00035E95D1|nr:hypothetical protein [Hahella ganghwensis]
MIAGRLRTIYADESCGEQAETIELPPETPGQQGLATEKMIELSKELNRDRRIAELQRQIRGQEQALEQLTASYEDDKARLEDALEKHLRGANSDISYQHPYRRVAYHERKRRLEEDINQLYFDYRSIRQPIIDRLRELKQSLAAL